MKLSQRFAQAGKELVKANFGNVIKTLSYSEPVNPSSYRQVGNGMWFFGNDGIDVWFSHTGCKSAMKAYEECAPLNAVINKKAQSFTNGKTLVLNSAGKESQSPEAKKLRKLLKKPNGIQNFEEFEARLYIFTQLFGWAMILPIKPFGFPNIDATSLWILPPHMLEIEESESVFYREDGKKLIKKITLVYKNTRVNIDPDHVWIVKDFTPSMDSVILPESRTKHLKGQINNIIGTYESRGVMIDRRGPTYVISSNMSDAGGLTSIPKGEKDEVLKQFGEGYGWKRKQSSAIITSAAVRVDSVGFSTKDLMFFEEIEDDLMRICDSYSFPYPLMASNRTNSLGGNNIGESKKLLYQDAIIPESCSIYAQLSLFFGLEDMNIYLQKDYSGIAALQEDSYKKSQARKLMDDALLIEFKNNLITYNRWLELNGEEKVASMDVYYKDLLAMGWVFGDTPKPANDQQNNNNDQNSGQNNA
jgi:hypothetical protein